MNLEDKEYFKKLKEEYPYTPDKDILNAILKEKEATREYAERLKNNIQCENCIYFQKAESISQIMARVGHCQRYPPRNISPELNPEEFGPEDIALSVPDFPLVYKTDWCGEFKPKKGIKTKVEQTPNNQLSKKGVPKMRDSVRRAIFQISLSNKHPINGHKRGEQNDGCNKRIY